MLGAGLKGSILYYDGLHNDTRMNVLIALTAHECGAAIANYVETVGVLHDAAEGGASCVVRVKDKLSGAAWDIRAKGPSHAYVDMFYDPSFCVYVHLLFPRQRWALRYSQRHGAGLEPCAVRIARIGASSAQSLSSVFPAMRNFWHPS